MLALGGEVLALGGEMLALGAEVLALGGEVLEVGEKTGYKCGGGQGLKCPNRGQAGG